MGYDAEEQERTNREHAANPLVGDYWQEHFCPVAVVVLVSPTYVLTIEKKKSVDADHWTWDLTSKPHIYTRKEFLFRFTYGRCDNPNFQGNSNLTDIRNKYYCDVLPEQHKWIERELATV
jgi:hypothetical protein